MRRPKVGERFRCAYRAEDGKQTDGKIIVSNFVDEEVIVLYAGHSVTHECGIVRRDAIAYPAIALVLAPDWFFEGGDTDSFYYEDLDWNSNEGGEGIWFVR